MRLETYLVNAFAEGLAEGNPAGVVIAEGELAPGLMQAIAIDLGKSETAFVRPLGPGAYALRWFAPGGEVPLCGHATLAAATVIAETRGEPDLAFSYAGGELRVVVADGEAALDLPLDQYEETPPDPRYEAFFGPLRVEARIRGRSTGKVVLVVPEGEDLGRLRPDFAAMRREAGPFSRGLGVSRRSSEYDFETRYFNPWYGVDEDYVTGTVHTVLAGYWRDRLGKDRLRAFQRSPRPGVLDLELRGELVRVRGRARVVLRGEFLA